MALDANRLKDEIKAAYQDAEQNGGNTREEQLNYFCLKLATAIVKEIKELKIIYGGGLTAGSNSVIGNINHTVS